MDSIFGIVLAATFGAIFGSYATLFAYRLPLGESCFGRYFGPKSRCPECGAVIKTRDLIPLINWLFTLGRCRKCEAKIPRTHLFVEVATTSLFVLSYIKFSFSEQFLIYAMISVGLVILVTTDFTHKIFPSEVLNFVLMISLVNRVLQDGGILDVIFTVAIGVIFASIFYNAFYKRNSTLFSTQKQSFNYVKFILIGSVAFHLNLFLFYFLTLMVILTMLLLFNVPNKKKRTSFGYAFIIPFIWFLFFPPVFYQV